MDESVLGQPRAAVGMWLREDSHRHATEIRTGSTKASRGQQESGVTKQRRTQTFGNAKRERGDAANVETHIGGSETNANSNLDLRQSANRGQKLEPRL